jgi:hypothetical protein
VAAKRREGKRKDKQTLRNNATDVAIIVDEAADVGRCTLVPTDSHHVGGLFFAPLRRIPSSFQLRAPEQVARQVARLKGT